MNIREFFWAFLPDECEVSDCCRQGVRGNENIIYPFPEEQSFGIIVCDYCNSKYEHGEVLNVTAIWTRLIVKEGGSVVDFKYRSKLRDDEIRKG